MQRPTIRFSSRGESGNIFWILGKVRQEMQKQRRIAEYNDMWERVQKTDYRGALAILRESKEFFSKERGSSQKERWSAKPRLRSSAKPLEELKPEKEKSFTAPEKYAMGVAGNLLPGYEEDPALPYFISYVMEKTFRRGVHEMKEKYGENAVRESGFSA